MKLLPASKSARAVTVRSLFVCAGLLGLATLAACGGSGSTPAAQQAAAPSFNTQPKQQTAAVGQTATFSASVSGTTPLRYQWLRNGEVISGAVASSYTTAPAALADSADVLRLRVTNDQGTVTSDPALLLVDGVGVRTLAGRSADSALSMVDGAGKEARLQAPGAMTWDSAGNLLVVEPARQAIRKISPAGVVTTWYDGAAAGAGLRFPRAIAAGSGGVVYVLEGLSADLAGSPAALRRIGADGVVSSIALVPDQGDPRASDGTLLPTQLSALAADASGNVYVASQVTRPGPASCSSCLSRSLVRRIAADGKVTVLLASERAPAPMGRIDALAVDKAGNVFALDAGQLFRIAASGNVTIAFENNGAYINAIAVDGAGNVLFSAAEFSGRASTWPSGAIGKLTPDGKVLVLADPKTDARFAVPAQLDSSSAIAVDAAGAVYLSRFSSIRKLVLP